MGTGGSRSDRARRVANVALAIGLASLAAVWAAFEFQVLGGLSFLGGCLVAGFVLGFGIWGRLNAGQFAQPPEP